jgi:antidote-toxin recognition MazE-like antitoxin
MPSMGEATSLTKNSPKFASLRTTVPISVVKQWKLQEGDKLDWEWKVVDGEMVLIVKKLK